MMRTLVVIPAFNEEESIVSVVENLIAHCPQYDYLIIDDCSTDGTGRLLKERGYRHLTLPVNLGIGGGVQCGYRYAVEHGYDIVVQMDGDGQHDPLYIKNLIQPIESGRLDMVIGSRFVEKQGFQTSGLRRTGIHILKWVVRLCCGVTIVDTTSGFRAANKALSELFSHEYAQDYPEPEAIVAASLHGFRIGEVPVVMKERIGGSSSIKTIRSIYYMIKVSLALVIHCLRPRGKGGNAV